MNTSSYTAFKGAYMHFFFTVYTPDLLEQQGIAEDLQAILAPHVQRFYPYPNLATDPDPGDSCAFM